MSEPVRTIPERLRKIKDSIRSEGLTGYIRRLVWLGIYRHTALRLLRRHRLTRQTARVFGVDLRLPDGRRAGIVEELLLYGIHEPAATAFYQSLLRPGMTVLDVGTNIGYYLAVASERIGESGRIVGLEPDPELHRIAQQNAERMAAPIDVLHAAVSDTDGYAEFYPSEVSNWGALRKAPDLKQLSPLRVRTVTIDTLCKELSLEPDAVRMDIEGLEAAALSGAEEVLRRRPVLFIELHLYVLSDNDKDKLASRLSDYDRFVAISRYYDWPYSHAAAQQSQRWEFDSHELSSFMRRPDLPPVVTLFAID